MPLFNLLLAILIVALIFGVIWWGITQIPIPAPFNTVVRIVFVIAVVLTLVALLTGHWSFPILGLR